jgi:hypothetical protein
MTEQQARAHYNYLMTLCIRREEAFGPLAMAFIRANDLDALGLTPDEQLNLFLSTAEAFPPEPRRYAQKLQYLKRAQQALTRTARPQDDLGGRIGQEIEKITAELELFNQAFQQAVTAPQGSRVQVVFETDLPHYFLKVAQQKAAEFYRSKYTVGTDAAIGLNFKGPTRHFDPENLAIRKDIAGACVPFMNARLNAFHLMLPFDLKISRAGEDPLEAGTRIWYVDREYSFPLSYQRGRFCSWYDGEVVDIDLDDPHLRYVSVSRIKEPEVGDIRRSLPPGMPFDEALPRSFLDGADALGPYIQIGCNFKVWFNAGQTSVLTQGAPDLHEYGLAGGSGLITRTYAAEKVAAYAEVGNEPWQEGLSFNFVNIHLELLPGVDAALVPFNTPLFTVYFVQGEQVEVKDWRDL